jgi:hypothetical protein
MPGIDRHLRDCLIAGFISFVAVAFLVYQRYQSLRLAGLLGAVASVVVTTGVVFPDIDINSSKPYRWAVAIGTGAATIGIGYFALTNWQLFLSYVAAFIGGVIPRGVPLQAVGLVLIGLTIYPVKVGLAKGIDEVTGSHRTRAHNPALLTTVALVSAGALWFILPPLTIFGVSLRPFIALGAPALFLIGALIHIGRDKIS